MNRRYLQNRATRGNQPLEPLSPRQPRNRARLRIPGADFRKRREMLPHQIQVQIRPEQAELILIEPHPALQESTLQAVHHYTDVEKLPTFGAWDQAESRIVIGVLFAHGRPPRQILVRSSAAHS